MHRLSSCEARISCFTAFERVVTVGSNDNTLSSRHKERLRLVKLGRGLDESDTAAIAVDLHADPGGESLCRAGNSHDSWNSVLPGQEGAVAEYATGLCDQTRDEGENASPSGVEVTGYEDITRSNLWDVSRRLQHPRRANF